MTSNTTISNITAITTSTTGNSTIRYGWVSQPNQRGSIDIIWSCVFTLIICLWTMLHLNLPAPNDNSWTIFWRRTRWLLLGIPAPELLMTFAFAQWSSARRSRAEMCRVGNTDGKWTMVHAFYADMGGFVLHTPDA